MGKDPAPERVLQSAPARLGAADGHAADGHRACGRGRQPYGTSGAAKLLVLSQVVLNRELPFAVAPLVQFTGDRELMGGFVNPAWMKVAAWTISAVSTSSC